MMKTPTMSTLSTTMMTSPTQFPMDNDCEWPSLSSPSYQQVVNDHEVGGTITESSTGHDWELLVTANDTGIGERISTNVNNVDGTAQDALPFQHVVLHHSASSPDFRPTITRSTESDDDEDDDDDDDDEFFVMPDPSEVAIMLDSEIGEDMSQYSMISEPASVLSMSTTATNGKAVSYRDAILRSSITQARRRSAATMSADELNISQQQQQQKRQQYVHRKKMKPRFVVVAPPMRRCSRSTGDLPSLAEVAASAFMITTTSQETTQLHHDTHQIMGDTDAMEFYHQKARGDRGRMNGLKLRPDELKRKQFAMEKRDMQRQQQQQCQR